MLAVFLFIMLSLSILLYDKYSFVFLSIKKSAALRQPLTWLTVVIIGILAVAAATFALRHAEENTYSTFIILLLLVSWAANIFYLLPLSRLPARLSFSLLGATGIVLVALWFPSQHYFNIVTAGSILWVGPILFRRIKLSLRIFILLAIAFTAYDAVNIWVLPELTFESDPSPLLNGLVGFDGQILGVGDFLLGYLLVGAGRHFFSRSIAWLCAVWIPLPLLFIQWLSAVESHVIYPYTVFVVPVVLIIFVIAKRRSAAKQVL